MHSLHSFYLSTALAAAAVSADSYLPCPLLRAYVPPPTIDKASEEVASLTRDFTAVFDQLVQTGKSDDFGEVTPNTTSFSVVLFTGDKDTAEDPVLFEYQHTAAAVKASENVTVDSRFPVGTLTQLFTVYAWLAEIGDGEWNTLITNFLPELKHAKNISSFDGVPQVNWDEITIGALASQMSGLARDSYACSVDAPCNKTDFIKAFGSRAPLFLPDTTPIISNAAFQLLAFALESRKHGAFADIFSKSIIDPLGLEKTGFLGRGKAQPRLFGQSLNTSTSTKGEQAALSLYSSARDLARAGNAMLSSRLLTPAQTRRWMQPVADTSNLRNGVGRPWEIYHAPQAATNINNSSIIVDVFTKTGSIGPYSSYFGLAPDFALGFAILAHDAAAPNPDLNVYADVVSLALVKVQELAVKETAARYAGRFATGGRTGSRAAFNVSDEGPGLVVEELVVDGADLRAEAAAAKGIKLASLDFRLYPANVRTKTQHQFVAVLQDRDAPVDQGTPTCITWQDVDSLGQDAVSRVVFELNDKGIATAVFLPAKRVELSKS
ncbi:beta-lactamase/transpeptidase-like protein [Xylariaceae sp. FL0662B]|nr:beta-lactamase/transpeptidase-like protein [Xylariaceae sp. FL0662B]